MKLLSTAAFVFLTGLSVRAESVMDAKTIEKMSASAVVSADHEQVAKQYRLRAQSLEKQAEKHEANARRMREVQNPMAAKWPALGRAPEEREKRLAMQARRAAQECLAQANRHTQLAAKGSGAPGRSVD